MSRKVENMKFGNGTYTGELNEEGQRHGYGIYKWKFLLSHFVYDGEWKDDKKNGHGIYKGAFGSVYDGEWKDDEKNGHGIYKGAFGDVYDGEWKDDRKNGHGIYKCLGDVYDGEFKDGYMNGHGIFKFADGSVYDGEYKDDKKNGHGIYKLPDGDVYDGEFKDDTWNGHGIFKYANGDVYDGEFKDNLFHGHGIYTFADGKKEKRYYQEDELITSESYIETRSVSESPKITAPSPSAIDPKITEALEMIVRQYGINAFQRNEKANAMIADLLPGERYTKQRKRFRFAIESGACDVLINGGNTKGHL